MEVFVNTSCKGDEANVERACHSEFFAPVSERERNQFVSFWQLVLVWPRSCPKWRSAMIAQLKTESNANAKELLMKQFWNLQSGSCLLLN